MSECRVENIIGAIESSLAGLKPSKAMGNCKGDAQAVIEHLRSKLCKTGNLIYMTPRDFDSPSDMLTIYSSQAGGLLRYPIIM